LGDKLKCVGLLLQINTVVCLQVSQPRCVFCKWGWVGPLQHNCRRIVFIGYTITTCFGRAWSSSSHKL